MYPAYNFAPNYELQLSFRDVKDVQHLYGEFSWIQKMECKFRKVADSCPMQTDRN